MPIIAMAEIMEINFQSIAWRPISPVKPTSELSAIINSDVPIASFIGSLIKITKAGINRKPPPAPRNPVTRPISTPYITKILGLDFALTAVSTFLLLIIATEAATIRIAKTTITKSECVTLKFPILKNTSGKYGMRNLRATNTVVMEDDPNNKTVLKFTSPLR